MIDLVLRWATGARALASLVTFAVVGTLLFRLSPYDALKDRVGGASLPEETVTSPDRFGEVLETLEAAGRSQYLQFQLWDVLNPLLLGLTGALLLGWLLKRGRRSDTRWRYVITLPVVLLVADLLENLVISLGIAAFPDRSLLVGALPFVTAAKFGAAVTTFVAILVMGSLALRVKHIGGR